VATSGSPWCLDQGFELFMLIGSNHIIRLEFFSFLVLKSICFLQINCCIPVGEFQIRSNPMSCCLHPCFASEKSHCFPPKSQFFQKKIVKYLSNPKPANFSGALDVPQQPTEARALKGMGTIVIPSEAPKPKPSRATERINKYACAWLSMGLLFYFCLLTYDW